MAINRKGFLQHLLTATLIATTLASPVSAFDVDVDEREVDRMLGRYRLSEINVGQVASMRVGSVCEQDNQLYILNGAVFEFRNIDQFEARRLPDGSFDLTFVSYNFSGERDDEIYSYVLTFDSCDYARLTEGVTESFRVNSVDGFTRYSEWLEFMLETYEIP